MYSATGTPSLMFVPAENYEVEYITDLVEVAVPIKGVFPDDYKKKGEFNLCPEEGLFLEGTLLDVLFAFKAYPKLEGDERFVLAGRSTDVENNKLTLVGRVIRLSIAEKK
jgi:hypothetical protein